MQDRERQHYEERIAQLEAENAQLRRELQQAMSLIARQAEQIAVLQARVGRDSQNSSKPPASDGLKRRPRLPRVRGQKPSGGQIGHEGHALQRVAEPDERVAVRPATCQCCGADLNETKGAVVDLTLLDWHRKRGQEDIRSLGVLSQFTGTVLHDR